MRPQSLMFWILLAALAPLPVCAGVLLPEDNVNATKDTLPNLGLIPKKIPVQSTQEQPQPKPPAPSLETANEAEQNDVDFFKSLDMPALRKDLPQDMQGLSDVELKKLMEYGRARSQNNSEAGNSGAVNLSNTTMKIALVPGGTLGAKKPTAYDKIMANSLSKGVAPQTSPMFAKAEQIAKEYRDSRAKSHARPMQVIKDRGMRQFESPLLKNLLSVTIAQNYVWGETSAERIVSRLGYNSPEQITKNCQLRLDVSLKTDDKKDLYNATLMSTDQKKIGYDGKLSSLEIRPLAVCHPPAALPQTGGIVFGYGDKIAVLLEKTSCDFPAQLRANGDREPSVVQIQYTGDAAVTCVFDNRK